MRRAKPRDLLREIKSWAESLACRPNQGSGLHVVGSKREGLRVERIRTRCNAILTAVTKR